MNQIKPGDLVKILNCESINRHNYLKPIIGHILKVVNIPNPTCVVLQTPSNDFEPFHTYEVELVYVSD